MTPTAFRTHTGGTVEFRPLHGSKTVGTLTLSDSTGVHVCALTLTDEDCAELAEALTPSPPVCAVCAHPTHPDHELCDFHAAEDHAHDMADRYREDLLP